MKHFSIITILTLGLLACGFDAKDRTSERDRQEQRDRELLKAAYEELNGFYTGVVDNPKATEVIFLMETVSESAGTGESGKERFSVVLKGRAYIIDSLDSYTFTGTYYQQNQELVLVGKDATDSFSLESGRFNLSTEQISGRLRERGGELGSVTLEKLSKTVRTPSEGWSEFELNRKKCFLQNIIGNYEGVVDNSAAAFGNIQAFSMNVSYNASGNLVSMFVPRTKDFKEIRGLQIPLQGQFNPRDKMISLETSASSNERTSYLDGYIENSYQLRDLNILYPAGSAGIASGVNVDRVDAIEACLEERRCGAKDVACRRSCQELCQDRSFLLKSLL